jgi:hypothetical protein
MKNFNKLLWLEVISPENSRTRPKFIKEIIGDLQQPKGMTSTVYRWTNLRNGKMYVGIHKETIKAYLTSSTNEDFLKDLVMDDASWRLEILMWGSVQECRQLEYEILSKDDARNNPLYYNKSNGSPGVKQCDYKKILTLREDIDAIRFEKAGYEFKMISEESVTEPIIVKELYEREGRVQTRSKEFIKENIDKIRNGIMSGNGEYHPPVYLKNRQFEGKHYDNICISGNHTLKSHYDEQAFRYKGLKTISISPEVHENFTDTEIRLLSNDLNRDRSVSEPFSKEDAIKEGIHLYEKGHSYETPELVDRWRDNGLTNSQINNVYGKIKQHIINGKKMASGMVIMNWKGGDHRHLFNEKVESIEGAHVYVLRKPYSSTSVRIQNIYNSYHREQNKRVLGGLEKHNRIVCFVYHSEEKQIKDWQDLKEDFEFMVESEGMTPVEFVELEMYMEDTSVSN